MARFLIVDDTDIVRRALELAVRKMGHEAQSASSGAEALALAVADPPAVALVDYRMPGMDGVALLSALRASLGERCPRVLFVTATPPDQIAGASGLAPAGYVRKPFHLDELAQAVAAVLAAPAVSG